MTSYRLIWRMPCVLISFSADDAPRWLAIHWGDGTRDTTRQTALLDAKVTKISVWFVPVLSTDCSLYGRRSGTEVTDSHAQILLRHNSSRAELCCELG